MFNYILLILIIIFISEILIFFNIKKKTYLTQKIFKKLIKISNLRDQQSFKKKYFKLLKSVTLKLFYILFTFVLLIICIYSLKYFSNNFLKIILSFEGIVTSFLLFIIYNKIRKYFYDKL